MPLPTPNSGHRALRVTLRAKLLIAVVSVAIVMGAVLLGYFGPHAERSFLNRSEALIERSSESMSELAQSHNIASQRILADLIHHSTDARRSALQDIPLLLYGGDVNKIRGAIEKQDTARAARLRKNVDVLGRELERRTDRNIEQHVSALSADQREISRVFGADLRSSYLVLSAGMLGVLLVLLVLGLDRSIVRPVHELRKATRQVAAGDLSVEFRNKPRDELGDLAGDFAAMVERLRSSREEIRSKNEELERWNTTLQEEVERKTRHLEQALANLKATQHKLVHADKMAAVGTLAGGIAHEFNNLIGGIRGCVSDALVDEHDAERREPLEVAMRATQRAASITEKLLRFARPRMEGLERVALSDLVTEVVDLVEPQARRQDVGVEVRVPDDLTVVVDSGEIHQVFLNLLTNALQAMPSGGSLVVDASRTDDDVEIRFTDTGVGIAADRMGHIFDPFYSSKTEPGRSTEAGSGLGLSVSFGIVEAHGGTLGVESEPGRGSTFTVTLPVNGPARTET